MKTLAIRLDDDLHAQLSLLAKLSGVSVTDAIRTAIETHVELLAADSELSAKAEAVLADIDREATERRAAIASLFGNESSSKAGESTRTNPRGPSRAKS